MDYELGCRLPVADWVWLNRTGAFRDPALRKYVSAFPPPELMQNVSGLVAEEDFASHGADFYLALTAASPIPLTDYKKILDFGCGCGRLARMFKGHPHEIDACDVDYRHVEWIGQNLSFLRASRSEVSPPLPYKDGQFDAIVSISVFTHLNEKSQDEFLSELFRVSQPGARLFVTVHGERALHRARTEPAIWDMVAVDRDLFQHACDDFSQGKHAFIPQRGHLTTKAPARFLDVFRRRKVISRPFEYGITFIPEGYVRAQWSQWFDIADYRRGALHSFQDLVVLTPKK